MVGSENIHIQINSETMPSVHFLGELKNINVEGNLVSVTFAIVPGNEYWNIRSGAAFGETMTTQTDEIQGVAILNHPIDIHYETSTIEGWPCIVVEVWDKENVGHRELLGCGVAWLPTTMENGTMDIPLWHIENEGI